MRRLLVTGGAGFIGSAFIRRVLRDTAGCELLVNLDLLTYAANIESVLPVLNDPRYLFVRADVRNGELVSQLLKQHAIDTVVHFAAETHVDRSIACPRPFYETNVGGTLSILEAAREAPGVRLHYVSTDEVYGSLGETGCFHEKSPYNPSSPYSASKAAADHFVRAYSTTYGICATISHCSNNYGPYQHIEKFVPQVITRAMQGLPIAIYGSGKQVRDWIYVEDHVEALLSILKGVKASSTYDIGGRCERSNLEMACLILQLLAEELDEDPKKMLSLITHVEERPGHDFRYALSSARIESELGWKPTVDLEAGLRNTIRHFQGALCTAARK